MYLGWIVAGLVYAWYKYHIWRYLDVNELWPCHDQSRIGSTPWKRYRNHTLSVVPVADKTTAGGMKNHFDSIDQVNNLREIQVGSWWGNGNHRELTCIDCVKPNQGPWENKSICIRLSLITLSYLQKSLRFLATASGSTHAQVFERRQIICAVYRFLFPLYEINHVGSLDIYHQSRYTM